MSIVREIAAAELDEWLREAFPRGEPEVIGREAVESFQQRIERIRVRTGGAERTVYVRVYRGFCSWWTLDTPDLPRRERSAWTAAARAGVPLPETLFWSERGDGTVALQAEAPGALPREGCSERAVEHLADVLARIHRARIDAHEAAHLPDASAPTLLDRFEAWTTEAGDVETVSAVREFRRRLPELRERPAGLIHGDAHLGNFLAEGDRITAALDWEEAARGDPRIDVRTAAWAIRRRLSPALADRFLTAYREQAGFDPGPLEPWDELTALRDRAVSAWMKHRVARGLPTPRTDPQAWM